MTEFVYEQINELNATLSSLFRDQSISVDTQSTNPTDLGATLEKDRDLTAFLTLASRDIDLSSNTTLPDIDAIQKYLSTYAQSPKQVTAVEDSLEWLFIAKCTVAVYGFLLKNILSSTLPLSEAIAYWNSIYGSTRYESYYALQSECLKFAPENLNRSLIQSLYYY
jgi:nuclear-control-of-ATPase protein 2